MHNSFFDKNGAGEGINTKFYKEIQMNSTILISVTTVSPLQQVVEEGELRTRWTYDLENNESGKEPFFSANGLRGILRRIGTRLTIEAMQKNNPNFKMDAVNLLTYTSGGGGDKGAVINGIDYKQAEKIRMFAPILSLFGAGLSQIEGKLAVCDLVPAGEHKRVVERNRGNGETFWDRSALIGEYFWCRKDSTDDMSMAAFVDMDDIEKWRTDFEALVRDSKDAKKAAKDAGDKNTKESASNISQIGKIGYILPGINMSSSIDSKYGQKLTDIELGLLISCVKELSQMQIGSNKRLGFGILEWKISMEDENGMQQVLVSTECDKDYILKRNVVITPFAEKYIKAWEVFAKNINHVKIEDILVA